MQSFREVLSKKILVMDGAMGTLLMKGGVRPEEGFDLQNLKRPDLVKSIHQSYIEAGADIIETCTFGANRLKLADYKAADKVAEINKAAVKIAKEAAEDKAYVCGSMGPLGKLLKPYGEISFDEAYEAFAEQAKALEEAGADLVCIETISDLQEMRAAIIAVKQNTKLPIISSMTYDENQTTIFGTPPEVHVTVAEALGADIISANCSTGPEGMLKVAKRFIACVQRAQVMVMPNAGLPELIDNQAVYKMTPEKFGRFASEFAKIGVMIIGGCCGTTPEHIREIKKQVTRNKIQTNQKIQSENYKCQFASRSKVVLIKNGELLKVGERINPTGKKAFQEELKAGRFGMIKEEAQAQTKVGADLLDTNVSAALTDDKKNMSLAIDTISKAVDTPLCIDSPKFEVLEIGLKEFCGRALLNSVNGKAESLAKILPLAKKYGAAIIGLCLDEKGLPESVEARVAISERIINKAKEAGFSPKEIFIDNLVLTAGVGIEGCLQTLEAVKKVKEKFKVKTILGLSNVSHGLPQRAKVNALYLRLALLNGLDAAILDPTDPEIKQVINDCRGAKFCASTSTEYENILSQFKAEIEKAKKAPSSSPTRSITSKNKSFRALKDIKELVIEGDAELTTAFVKEALEKKLDPQKIINEGLIAGMEKVGEKFSKKEYFLPQVLSSAQAMAVGFELCKARIPQDQTRSAGKVLLATVYGDIHDIGKNIVKMMLENHGFEVIDLGKDVPPDNILEAAKREKPSVIALSALLTTTMIEMGIVKQKLLAAGLKTPIIIGGAVVTLDYAQSIDALHGADAAEAVKLAKQIIKEAKT